MKTLRKILLTFLGIGLAIGIIFPLISSIFVNFKYGMLIFYIIVCIIAGILVGYVNFLIFRKILTKYIKSIINRLLEHSSKLNIKSNEVSLNIAGITTRFKDVSEGANVQRKGVYSIKDMIDNFVDLTKQTTNRVTRLNNQTKATLQIVKRENTIFHQAESELSNVKTLVKTSNEVIESISKKVQKMDEMLKAINKISEQTNLLSLNAAIEAAKAGEAGQGFAVVADEIRKLAEMSKKNSAKISDLIVNVQEETVNSVRTVNEEVRNMEKSIETINLALSSIIYIGGVTEKSAEDIESISSLAVNQSSGADKIIENVTEMNNISEQGANKIKETVFSLNQINSNSQELLAYSGELTDIIKKLNNLLD